MNKISKFEKWSDDQLCEVIEKYIDNTALGKHLSDWMRKTFVAEHRESREKMVGCVAMIEEELHLNLSVNDKV